MFDYSHSGGCVVVSHCSFDLHCSLMVNDVLLIAHLYIFFGEMYIQTLVLFYN